jgi:AcrR family transcriptional regulator
VPRLVDRKPEETRRRLVDAAVRYFARHGLHGASIRELTRAAGVNVAVVNYHFGSKEGLYDAAVDEVYSRLRERIGGSLQLAPPVRLETVLGDIYRAARKERDSVRLLVRQVLDTGRLTQRTVATHFLPELEQATGLAAQLLGTSRRRARTAMVALTFLMTRYLIQDDHSLAVAFGVSRAKEAVALALDTLVATARALLHKEKA